MRQRISPAFLPSFATACAMALFGPVAAQDTSEDFVRPAKVFTVSENDGVIRRSYPAIVLPSNEAVVSFRVSGQVTELPIGAADTVAVGDVIAKLDPSDFENQVAQLQSSYDQAEAQLEALRTGAREEEINALIAAVSSAQAQVDQTREALERTQALVDRGVSTNTQLEEAQANFLVAEANLVAQQEQLRIGQAGARAEDIAAAEAGLRGIEAQLKVAKDNLGYATLTAPFSGIIARREIDNFSNINAGAPVVLLQKIDVVHLAYDIPGPDITTFTSVVGPEQIKQTAIFDALPDQVFQAEIVEFSVQADTATQTYRGRAAVEVPDGVFILPGMVATLIAETPGTVAEIEVPLTAIAAAPDGSPFVWKLSDTNTVSQQPVSLGDASGANVIVLEGLAEGDTIIAAGVSQIIGGMTVRPISQAGNPISQAGN